MDNRVHLEISTIEEKKEEKVTIQVIMAQATQTPTVPGTQWDLKFFYPPHQQKVLEEKISEFKDKLFTAYKTYNLNEYENVFYMRTLGINKSASEAKRLIKEILKDDNSALLNTAIDDITLTHLCKFKMKVMIKDKVGYSVGIKNVSDLMEDD